MEIFCEAVLHDDCGVVFYYSADISDYALRTRRAVYQQ